MVSDERRRWALGAVRSRLTGVMLTDIVLRMSSDLDFFGFPTRPTLNLIDSHGDFDNAVLYAILHEAIYCQG